MRTAVAPQSLDRTFAAIIVDWDNVIAPDCPESLSGLVKLAEMLLLQQTWLALVTDLPFASIDQQFCGLIAPQARKRLLVCANAGSEIYGFDDHGAAERRFLRVLTAREDAALTAIATHALDDIRTKTGLNILVTHDQVNRRRLDLLPLPEWTDTPHSRGEELIQAVEARLHGAGLTGGLAQAIDLTQRIATELMPQARITTDIKHIDVGVTDKGDAIEWIKRELLRPAGIALSDTLIIRGQFNANARYAGSDGSLRWDIGDAIIASVGESVDSLPPDVQSHSGALTEFCTLLLDQICLLYDANLPLYSAKKEPQPWSTLNSAADQLWRLETRGYIPALEHSIESRFATGNGALGARGSLAQPTNAAHPGMFVAGLFDSDEALPDVPEIPALVPLPDISHFQVIIDGERLDLDQGVLWSLHRWLDLRRGVLVTEWRHCDANGRSIRIRSLRFASQRHRSLHVQVTQIAATQPMSVEVVTQTGLAIGTTQHLLRMHATPHVSNWRTFHSPWLLHLASRTSLTVEGEAIHELHKSAEGMNPECHWIWRAQSGQTALLTQIISLARQRAEPPMQTEDLDDTAGSHVVLAIRQARLIGLKRLLAEHERAWVERWAAGDIVIEGDDDAQRGLRFALYHLMSAANPEDERVSIGARGLTGEAYLGHVFWDTDIFMLPFYTFTWPAAARALLMYRYHTLPAARTKAARLGYAGALYAWESADTGEEVTPPFVRMPNGQVEPVRNGVQEQHISADVAYAVWQYWQATGDTAFILNAGAEIIFETARFWSSRAALEHDGRYHIRQIIGPDEYHYGVDDNAYTNELARWNIERGVELAALLKSQWPARWSTLRQRLNITSRELTRWRSVAAKLAIDRIPGSDVLEQFAGFSALEPIDLASLPAHGAPVDMLLGVERTNRSQIIKQADVVMLLMLLWDRYPANVREVNFRFYEPRCVHGSSLSPAVHALVAARLGDMALAERYLRQTAAIDLDDTMGNAALGVHLGALGGLWQAVAFGMTGLGLCPDGLSFDPHLPPSWRLLRIPVQWHRRLIRLTIEQSPLRFTAALERGKPLTLYLSKHHRRLRSGQSWRCHWDEVAQQWEEEDS